MEREKDERERFKQVYQVLKTELLQDPNFEYDHISRQWVHQVKIIRPIFCFFLLVNTYCSNLLLFSVTNSSQMLDYNVPGGRTYYKFYPSYSMQYGFLVFHCKIIVFDVYILFIFGSGKLNRGLSVIETYKLLNDGKQLHEDDLFRSSVLGWCIQWVCNFVVILYYH